MTRCLAFVVALTACAPRVERVDSADAALPAVDTLKAVTASDTAQLDSPQMTVGAPASTGSSPTRAVRPAPTPAPTKPRDSAFSPPRGLPKLDTVPTKRPPR